MEEVYIRLRGEKEQKLSLEQPGLEAVKTASRCLIKIVQGTTW